MKALVLSGGAVFGAYQAGVVRALEERGWRPGLVTGISIGAVNGWAISRGASAAELEGLWRDLPAELNHAASPSLWPWSRHTGLFREWLQEVAARYSRKPPVCRMQAVILEAPRMIPRLIEGENTGADELLAACSLPGALPPVRIGGKYYIDYGMVRCVPLKEALDAGASEIVAVDLLKEHPVPFARPLRNAAGRAWSLMRGRPIGEGHTAHVDARICTIAHRHPLGGPVNSFEWTRAKAETLIEKGYADAVEAWAEFIARSPAAAAIATLLPPSRTAADPGP